MNSSAIQTNQDRLVKNIPRKKKTGWCYVENMEPWNVCKYVITDERDFTSQTFARIIQISKRHSILYGEDMYESCLELSVKEIFTIGTWTRPLTQVRVRRWRLTVIVVDPHVANGTAELEREGEDVVLIRRVTNDERPVRLVAQYPLGHG